MEGAAAEGKKNKAALRVEGGAGGLPLRHGILAAAAAVGVALVAGAAARNRKKKKKKEEAERPSKDEDGESPPSPPLLPPPAENHLPRCRQRRVDEDLASEYETDVEVRVAVSKGVAPQESKILSTKHCTGGKDEEGSPEEEGKGFFEGTPSSSVALPLPPSPQVHLHPRDRARAAAPPAPPDSSTPEKNIEEERGRQVRREEEELTEGEETKTVEVVEEALEETEITPPDEVVKPSPLPAEIAAEREEETSTKKSRGSGLVALMASRRNSWNLVLWLSLFFLGVAATLLCQFSLRLPQSSPL